MSIIKNCTDVWSRLFDHKPFVHAELNSFVKEFEENRHDREVENLLDCLNIECEIKNECNKIISCENTTSQLLIEKVDASLAQAEHILKSNKAEDAKHLLEIRRQQREEKWTQFKKNMEPKYLEADVQFIKQQEAVKKFYEEQQNKLKEAQIMADHDLVQVKLSREVRSLFRTAVLAEDDDKVPEKIKKAAENKFKTAVTVDEIAWLQERLPEEKHLYKLFEKCEIILPQPKVEPRNPELEARIQKLKKQEEERTYRAMTKNVDSARVRHPEDSIACQMKEMNRQLIGVLQVLFSVATGFVFGFIGIEWIVGNLDTGVRLLLGITAALIIGVAELYFFIKKTSDPISPPPSPINDRKNK